MDSEKDLAEREAHLKSLVDQLSENELSASANKLRVDEDAILTEQRLATFQLELEAQAVGNPSHRLSSKLLLVCGVSWVWG